MNPITNGTRYMRAWKVLGTLDEAINVGRLLDYLTSRRLGPHAGGLHSTATSLAWGFPTASLVANWAGFSDARTDVRGVVQVKLVMRLPAVPVVVTILLTNVGGIDWRQGDIPEADRSRRCRGYMGQGLAAAADAQWRGWTDDHAGRRPDTILAIRPQIHGQAPLRVGRRLSKRPISAQMHYGYTGLEPRPRL